MDLRPFVLVVGVVVGIVVGERAGGPFATADAVLVAGAAAAGAAWFARRPARGALAVLACVLLGCAATGRALDGQARTQLAGAMDRRERVTVRATALGDATGAAYDASVLVRLDVGRGAHRTLLARATGSGIAALRVVEAGDRVVLDGRLASLGPGSVDQRARWRHAVGRLDGVQVVALGAPRGLLRVANAVRSVVLAGTRSLAPTPRALVAGFLLGDTRAIPRPVIDAYRASGLSHLLAVSGENVAFVMALGAPVLRRLRLGPRTAAALVIVVGFAAMTRFEPSVLRASAMAAITLLATLTGRPASTTRALAYAAVGLLIADPFLLHSVAFALSCGASAGIALLSGPLASRLRGPRFVREPLSVSLAAQIGVLPVLFSVFGSFPLVTPLANLLAAPAAELLGVYGFFASAVAGVAPAVGPLVQLPTALLVGWITAVARAGAAVSLPIDGRGALALAAVVSAAASLACLRARRAVPDSPAG